MMTTVTLAGEGLGRQIMSSGLAPRCVAKGSSVGQYAASSRTEYGIVYHHPISVDKQRDIHTQRQVEGQSDKRKVVQCTSANNCRVFFHTGAQPASESFRLTAEYGNLVPEADIDNSMFLFEIENILLLSVQSSAAIASLSSKADS
jgi:hypothetical protein